MQWMGRGKWTGTASLANTSAILSGIAALLGKKADADFYARLSRETSEAYRRILMDRDCRVKREFQTAYVLPLHYGMVSGEDAEKTAANLVRMVRENGYHIGTGFPGTPYILFALCDYGYPDDAYRMLLNDTCPSWLFQVKAGGTTPWERWDALREDGTSNTGAEDGTGGMVSFNHFAVGSVGDFLYRRVAGIEPLSGGYRTFRVSPVLGGGLEWARAEVTTAYGKVASRWSIEGSRFALDIEVPVGTECELVVPGDAPRILGSGIHHFEKDIDR